VIDRPYKIAFDASDGECLVLEDMTVKELSTKEVSTEQEEVSGRCRDVETVECPKCGMVTPVSRHGSLAVFFNCPYCGNGLFVG
jgi:predicted RNA-binding Zn-ribbon protein involved in translation (DUF1610 family)